MMLIIVIIIIKELGDRIASDMGEELGQLGARSDAQQLNWENIL